MCRTPARGMGTVVGVHVSTGGVHNFSASFATLTYYDSRAMQPGGGVTQVSEITPTYGPIAGGTVIVAHGANFAPTGWSADAIGTSPLLSCVVNPYSETPELPFSVWSDSWHQPKATFVNYHLVLCNERHRDLKPRSCCYC